MGSPLVRLFKTRRPSLRNDALSTLFGASIFCLASFSVTTMLAALGYERAIWASVNGAILFFAALGGYSLIDLDSQVFRLLKSPDAKIHAPYRMTVLANFFILYTFLLTTFVALNIRLPFGLGTFTQVPEVVHYIADAIIYLMVGFSIVKLRVITTFLDEKGRPDAKARLNSWSAYQNRVLRYLAYISTVFLMLLFAIESLSGREVLVGTLLTNLSLVLAYAIHNRMLSRVSADNLSPLDSAEAKQQKFGERMALAVFIFSALLPAAYAAGITAHLPDLLPGFFLGTELILISSVIRPELFVDKLIQWALRHRQLELRSLAEEIEGALEPPLLQEKEEGDTVS